MSHSKRSVAARFLLPTLASACLLTGGAAVAQVGGYKVNEEKQAAPVAPAAPVSPPVAANAPQAGAEGQREARFDYLNGKVTWRPDANSAWKKAATDLPLRAGAQIWVTDGGRAEVKFDDGSVLRIGTDSVVTLQSLFSDAQGEFTQVKMISGLVTVRPKLERSVFEVDTPVVTVNTAGPSRVRVGVDDSVEVGVKWGKATLNGKQGKMTLNASDFVDLRDADSPYDRMHLPRDDSWERWNDERDHVPAGAGRPVHGYPYPVYAPGPAFFFGLDIPIGGHGHWHGWGRGAWRR